MRPVRLFVGIVGIASLVAASGCHSRAQLNAELFKAASAGDVSEVNRLLDEGADPNSNNGDTEFNFTVLETSVEHPAVLKCLLKRGAKADIRDKNGSTALHYAAGANLESTTILLAAGLPVDITEKGGATPLYFAADMGSSANVRFLLRHGADPNHKDRNGITPLMRSMWSIGEKKDPVGTVRELLAGGADVTEKDNHGGTVFRWSQRLPKTEQGLQIISLLKSATKRKQ